MDDKVIEVLGDYFVKQNLADKGWTFEQFVDAWQTGYIEFSLKEK